jgi:peroxiredoxin Q/BCP
VPTGDSLSRRRAVSPHALFLDVRGAQSHGLTVLHLGDTAPDFEGVDQNGHRVTLDELVKDSALVLYFYPKDFTPVCTEQACLFRDAHSELLQSGIKIAGISTDNEASHSKFATEHRVPFPLIADSGKKISKAYAARHVFGLLTQRVTYVIDRQKKIRGVYHHELSAKKHLDDVRRIAGQFG